MMCCRPCWTDFHPKSMAAKRMKLPKELRKPKLASVVLEVSSKSGAPMSAKEKFRLRQAMRQFARAAIKDMPKWVLICKKCQVEFQHSQISDVGMTSPAEVSHITADQFTTATYSASVPSRYQSVRPNTRCPIDSPVVP